MDAAFTIEFGSFTGLFPLLSRKVESSIVIVWHGVLEGRRILIPLHLRVLRNSVLLRSGSFLIVKASSQVLLSLLKSLDFILLDLLGIGSVVTRRLVAACWFTEVALDKLHEAICIDLRVVALSVTNVLSALSRRLLRLCHLHNVGTLCSLMPVRRNVLRYLVGVLQILSLDIRGLQVVGRAVNRYRISLFPLF